MKVVCIDELSKTKQRQASAVAGRATTRRRRRSTALPSTFSNRHEILTT
jgi:hypothetical protein